MGVPKFFKWLTERYPLILQDIDQTFRPQFDNLYLDMNGIIHNCSHGNGSVGEMTEEEMVQNIFSYIDHLFRLVRPKKTLFMAIDGCAPRAKMNQQRSRRFRSAKEAKEAREKKVKAGEISADHESFDSNCITPGTGFMARLSDHLEYFVSQRMQTEKAWRDVEVILSGHQVAGEGEHKIMDYIRLHRHNGDWEPERSHCLYGLDADLIMLGLASHEPNFALLREEVLFGRGGKTRAGRATEKKESTLPKFQLLFVSLVREYLGMEFGDQHPESGFDLERMLDDFVFICYFIGNDFLPHLPFLDIGEGSLDKLFACYKSSLSKMDDYITNSGDVNLERCNILLQSLVADEIEMLMEHSNENDWWLHVEPLDKTDSSSSSSNSHGGNKKKNAIKKAITQSIKEAGASSSSSSNPASLESSSGLDLDEVAAMLDQQSEDGVKNVEDEVGQLEHLDSDELQLVNYAHNQDDMNYDSTVVSNIKRRYYQAKFPDYDESTFRQTVVRSYIEGLIWVYQYYYRGCSSWKWFYPYHYAPLISDLVNLQAFDDIEFELSEPFLPFQQLMSVLPRLSYKLLPTPYSDLMLDDDAPIADFYPETFEMDMDGKRNDWEAVILLPFIDETRLFAAMAEVDESAMTQEERDRNCHGPALLYRFDSGAKGRSLQTTLPGILPSLHNVTVSCEEYDIMAEENFLECRFLPIIRPGFFVQPGYPVLDGVEFTTKIYKAHVKLHNFPSKKPSLMLELKTAKQAKKKNKKNKNKNKKKKHGKQNDDEEDEEEEHEEEETEGDLDEEGKGKEVEAEDGDNFAIEYDDTRVLKYNFQKTKGSIQEVATVAMGKVVVGDWPYIKKAKIVELVSKNTTVSINAKGNISTKKTNTWKRMLADVTEEYHTCRGIDLGNTSMLAKLQFINSVNVDSHGTSTYRFEEGELQYYPLQTLLSLDHLETQRFELKDQLSLEDLYAVGSSVVYVGEYPFYGAMGEVLGVDEENQSLNLLLSVPKYQPVEFGDAIDKACQYNYYSHSEVTQLSNLPSKIVTKLLGHLTAEPGNRPIGMNVRDTRQPLKQCDGFTRASPPSNNSQYWDWEYSAQCINMLNAYQTTFSDVVDLLQARPNERRLNLQHTNVNHKKLYDDLNEFMEASGMNKVEMVPGGSFMMTPEGVKAVEEAIAEIGELLNERVPIEIYNVSPSLVSRPAFNQDMALNAEPLSVAERIQIGDRVMYTVDDGFVPLGMHGTVIGIWDSNLDVVFDQQWFNGGYLGTKLQNRYGATVPCCTVINLTDVQPRTGDLTPTVDEFEPEMLPEIEAVKAASKFVPPGLDQKLTRGKKGKNRRNNNNNNNNSSNNKNNKNNQNQNQNHQGKGKGKHPKVLVKGGGDKKRGGPGKSKQQNDQGYGGNKKGNRQYHQKQSGGSGGSGGSSAGERKVNVQRMGALEQLELLKQSSFGSHNSDTTTPMVMDVSMLENQLTSQNSSGSSTLQGHGLDTFQAMMNQQTMLQQQQQQPQQSQNVGYGGPHWNVQQQRYTQNPQTQNVLQHLFTQNSLGQQQTQQPQQQFQNYQVQGQFNQQFQQFSGSNVDSFGNVSTFSGGTNDGFGYANNNNTTSVNNQSIGNHQMLFEGSGLATDEQSSNLLNSILQDMKSPEQDDQKQQTTTKKKKKRPKKKKKKKGSNEDGNEDSGGNGNGNGGGNGGGNKFKGRIPPQVALRLAKE
eukprot:TRINITY_DN516_c0_g1_i13.p1 TRINITY_DN516_c0_g1~~TRINITY_DN516_c0_g1_i13.p1  ORF type:complete len:1695 (+),score=691.11 TRINITY_DN516_c0_g1_i13:811-5895(+)